MNTLPYRRWFIVGTLITIINVFAFFFALNRWLRFTVRVFLTNLFVRYPLASFLWNFITGGS